MLKNIKDSTLIYEEKRTLKWFLVLFFAISILYDGFYYFIMPAFITGEAVVMPSLFGYFIYAFTLILTAVSYIFYKNKSTGLIKYIVVGSFLGLTVINELILIIESNSEFAAGNIVEIFLIMFSPIFLNRRFFLFVSTLVILKYFIIGMIAQEFVVALPILVILLISSLSYVLLQRILGYVDGIKVSYNRQLEGIVKGIIATLELKDPYTKGHSERVAFYALSLAKKLNVYTKEQLDSFYYACLLHDIGKIHIPDKILMKPDRLTKEEFDVIKTHPAVGAEAVEKVEQLNDSLSVILSHHERWDGKGYPHGKKGSEIPLAARITAIADAFDAMTSTRSYRQALSSDSAYKRILEGQGTQFDPDLVKVFIDVFPEWVEMRTDSGFSNATEEKPLQEFITL